MCSLLHSTRGSLKLFGTTRDGISFTSGSFLVSDSFSVSNSGCNICRPFAFRPKNSVFLRNRCRWFRTWYLFVELCKWSLIVELFAFLRIRMTITRGNTVTLFLNYFSCPSARAFRAPAQTPWKIHGRGLIRAGVIRYKVYITMIT